MSRKSEVPHLQDLIIPLPRMTLHPPIPVQQIDEGDSSSKFFGYAVNLTREGIFVPTMNPRPVGFRTRIRLELPRLKEVVEGEIEVIWSKEFDPRKIGRAAGMGLKFIDLSEEKKQVIDSFLGV